MKQMLCVILGDIAAVCAARWFVNYLAFQTILEFIKMKNYAPPTKSELSACSREAVKRIFTFGRRKRR